MTKIYFILHNYTDYHHDFGIHTYIALPLYTYTFHICFYIYSSVYINEALDEIEIYIPIKYFYLITTNFILI